DELETLADQFNQTAAQLQESYANLEQKVEARTKELTEALEQQTATGDILRVISSSPTDVQPVFDAIVQSAVRLSGGVQGGVHRFDGEHLHLAAQTNWTPGALENIARLYATPIHAVDTVVSKAILNRAIVHVADAERDPDVPHASRQLMRAL